MQNGELAIYYEMELGESIEQRGIIETEHFTSRLILLLSFTYVYAHVWQLTIFYFFEFLCSILNHAIKVSL